MKVVALASDKGGMGKSTAAINLACAAADAGIEAAILDLDPQASVGRWARVRKKAGLAPRPFAEVCVPIQVEDRLAELKEAGAQLVLLDTAGRDNNAISSAIATAGSCPNPVSPDRSRALDPRADARATARRPKTTLRPSDRLVSWRGSAKERCDCRHRKGRGEGGAGRLHPPSRLPSRDRARARGNGGTNRTNQRRVRSAPFGHGCARKSPLLVQSHSALLSEGGNDTQTHRLGRSRYRE